MVYEESSQDTPCDKCPEGFNKQEFIKIKDINKDFIKIYTLVQGQMIMGFNGAIDLNLVAIKIAIDMYDVPKELQPLCVNVCRRTWNYFYQKKNESN